jgi:hypothetical protein
MHLQTDHTHGERSHSHFKVIPQKHPFNSKAETAKFFKEELAKSEARLF